MDQFLKREETGLWIVDLQEKLFPLMDRTCEVLERICFSIEAAKALQIPFLVTEQYPQGLGPTIEPVQLRLPKEQPVHHKTTFSGYFDPEIKKAVDRSGKKNWILVGIEAHICVLQTAKDLLEAGYRVVVLNDATSARSLFDFSTAMGELRDVGARLTSSETVFYEMVRDADSPFFKPLLEVMKRCTHA